LLNILTLLAPTYTYKYIYTEMSLVNNNST